MYVTHQLYFGLFDLVLSLFMYIPVNLLIIFYLQWKHMWYNMKKCCAHEIMAKYGSYYLLFKPIKR